MMGVSPLWKVSRDCYENSGDSKSKDVVQDIHDDEEDNDDDDNL